MKIQIRVAAAFGLLVSLGSILTTAHAQGTAFTYQGRLNDGVAPANGTYDLRFALYDAASAGAQNGLLVTNSATVVTNGLFAVTLDFGNQFPGADRWLEIAVRPNGGSGFSALTPRQALMSTPYAVQAANATTATTASAVPAGNITGTILPTQLPANVITNGASGVNFSGTFSGNGAGVTNVDLRTVNGQGALSFSTNYLGFVLSSSPIVGVGPVTVIAADVDGDAKPDLISGNTTVGTLTILTIKGSGGFGSNATLNPSGLGGVSSVIATDVNGDGNVDLISTPHFNAVGAGMVLTVLTNNGGGHFTLSASPVVPTHTIRIAAADIDGDGRLDLVTAANSQVTVWTNNGHGGFVTNDTLSVGQNTSPFVNSAICADMNGDSWPDLVVGSEELSGSSIGRVTVFTNNTIGRFGFRETFTVGGPVNSVAAVDFDSDGKVDLACAVPDHAPFGGSLAIFLNYFAASPSFVPLNTPAVGSSLSSVVAADVNNDGKPDFVCADSGNNSLIVMTNKGAGYFLNGGGFVLAATPSVGSNPYSAIVADVDGNGRLDLISANFGSGGAGNTLSVLLNQLIMTGTFVGDGSGLTGINVAITNFNATNLVGTLTAGQLPPGVVFNGASGVNLGGTFSGSGAGLTGLNASQLTAGIIPAAQLPSTIAGNFFGTFMGNGAGLTNINLNSVGPLGTFSATPIFPPGNSFAVGNNPYSVAAADMNGDGRMDLISANYNDHTLTVLTNNGNSIFGLSATITANFNPSFVVAADVNADGRLDLVCSALGASKVLVFTNSASGVFGGSSTNGVGAVTVAVTVGDVNGDGRPDIVCANQNSDTLTVLTNRSGGYFTNAATLPVPVNAFPSSVVLADVNGDGINDLVCANRSLATVQVFTNNGSGSFATKVTVGVGNLPICVAAMDVNGDGRMEFVTANSGGSSLTVLTNDGSGILISNATVSVGNSPQFVTAADLNGDGRTDLISANNTGNSLTVVTNNGTGGFGLYATLATGAGSGPGAVAAADLNGDGRLDLISANRTTNTLSVFLNNQGVIAQAFSGYFTGNGGGLTNINASAISGALTTNIVIGGFTFYITNGLIFRIQ